MSGVGDCFALAELAEEHREGCTRLEYGGVGGVEGDRLLLLGVAKWGPRVSARTQKHTHRHTERTQSPSHARCVHNACNRG